MAPVTNTAVVAPPSWAPPGFDAWKLTQPDYVANFADLQRRRQQILDMLGGVNDTQGTTQYGQLNVQHKQDLGVSRQSAANAGFFGGGALESLKQGNVNTLERGRFAAQSQANQSVGDVDKSIADLERNSSAAYNEWLAKNAPTNKTPEEVAAENDNEAPVPDQAVATKQWENDARSFGQASMNRIDKEPLKVVKGITAYLTENGQFLSPIMKKYLMEMRETATKRYYQMTRGKK